MNNLLNLTEYLPWDSEFFGKRIARVIPKTLTQTDLALIDEWTKENLIDCLYFLSDSVGGAEIIEVQQAGFRLMDLRVTFFHDPRKTFLSPELDYSAIVQANLADIPVLRKIAAHNHRDSRFYSDTHFNRELSDTMYAIWIEKAVCDPQQKVFVYKTQGEPLGYVSYKLLENKVAEIGLVGISPAQRGKGIGFMLIQFLLDQLKNEHASKVTVVTQGKNVGALNLYEKAGFRIFKIESWFHKWYE